jgi:hypothetical protein
MAKKDVDKEVLDSKQAAKLLDTHWKAVLSEAGKKQDIEYVTDVDLRQAIHASVNHKQVTYRFCLCRRKRGIKTTSLVGTREAWEVELWRRLIKRKKMSSAPQTILTSATP